MKRLGILIIISSIFLIPYSLFLFSVVHAQGIPNSINGLTLTASSDNPIPGQSVTITAQSYSFDINAATITWIVNGTRAAQGVGKTTLAVQAPALNKISRVEVTALTPDGRSFSAALSISSAYVDLIIEPDGYVPAFFMGKLPVAYQNNVKVVAIPHLADPSGKEYDPKTLIYQWKKDSGAVIQEQSGYGKQAVVLAGALVPRLYSVIVDVSSRDGSAHAEGMISISPQVPSLSFYIDDPLYGPLFNRAISNTVRIGSEKETGALAVPFGFNKPLNNLGDLALSWLINGNERTELNSNDSIILRAPEGSSGSSNVELRIDNKRNILQSADSGFSVAFSNTASSTTADKITF